MFVGVSEIRDVDGNVRGGALVERISGRTVIYPVWTDEPEEA